MKIKILKLQFELKKKNLCLDLSWQMLKKYQTIIHLLKEIN